LRIEAKNAITDRIAKAILTNEKAVVDAKTERLQAAQLKRDNNEKRGR
jgi:hypothetical protein